MRQGVKGAAGGRHPTNHRITDLSKSKPHMNVCEACVLCEEMRNAGKLQEIFQLSQGAFVSAQTSRRHTKESLLIRYLVSREVRGRECGKAFSELPLHSLLFGLAVFGDLGFVQGLPLRQAAILAWNQRPRVSKKTGLS